MYILWVSRAQTPKPVAAISRADSAKNYKLQEHHANRAIMPIVRPHHSAPRIFEREEILRSEIRYYPTCTYPTPSKSPLDTHLLRLLKQIMTNPPRITSIPPKQLTTRQIENLPPIPPSQRPFLPIRLHQPLPDTLLIAQHSRQPILTRLAIMQPTNPPLPLNLEIILKEQQKIRTRHRASREEMLRHPPALEIIRCILVRENVHKQLPTWFEGARDFGHEERVVLHVFEEFDGEDAVVDCCVEFMVYNIAGNDGEVLEALGRGDGVDVLFLRARVGEAGYAAVGEDFGQVEGEGAPAATLGGVSAGT
jgi:hypothetical protein